MNIAVDGSDWEPNLSHNLAKKEKIVRLKNISLFDLKICPVFDYWMCPEFRPAFCVTTNANLKCRWLKFFYHTLGSLNSSF